MKKVKYIANCAFNKNIKANLTFLVDKFYHIFSFDKFNLVSVTLTCNNINICKKENCIFSYLKRYEESIPAEKKCYLIDNYNLYNCNITGCRSFNINYENFIITHYFDSEDNFFTFDKII